MKTLYAFRDKIDKRLWGAYVDHKGRFVLRTKPLTEEPVDPNNINEIAVLIFTNLKAAKRALTKRDSYKTDVVICPEEYRENLEIVQVWVEMGAKK